MKSCLNICVKLVNSTSFILRKNKTALNSIYRTASTMETSYETLRLSKPADFVCQVELNRPDKRNAMNPTFWREIRECFNALAQDPDCRSIVITGAGKLFTSGLDLTESGIDFHSDEGNQDVARRAFHLKRKILEYQNSFTAIEQCPKPVIVAIHNGCIGGGVDLICACDIRYCSKDAWFQVKEVDIGLAADVGTLQRLPKIVGSTSFVSELVFSARKIDAAEAKEHGLVSRVFDTRENLIAGAVQMATLIASKSPIAVQSSKINLIYARDHSVRDGLDYVATWNQVMLQSEDVLASIAGAIQKTTPTFSKL